MKQKPFSRRRFVATSAAASASMIAAPFVRTAHAAGKLTLGFWDHFVPGRQQDVRRADPGVGGQGEGRGPDRPLYRCQDAHHARGRGQCQVGTRHRLHDELVAARLRQEPRAGRRHHGRADQAERPSERHGHLSGARAERVARGAGDHRQPDPGALLAHRPDEAARRHRRSSHVSGGRAAQGRRLDARYVLQGRRGLPQGGLPVRHRARPDGGFGRRRRRHLPVLRGGARRCQREDHGQERSRAPGPRLLRAACPVLSARCGGLGQRFQQQVADLGPRRADPEPSERVGRGKARRAAGCRAVVDARHALGPEGPLRAVPAVLLGHLELQQEQVGGQEPARASFAAHVDREAGGRERRLRPAALHEILHASDLGRGRAAEGHALPLSQPAQPSGAVDRRGPVAAEDRGADFHAGHHDQDDRAPPARARRWSRP